MVVVSLFILFIVLVLSSPPLPNIPSDFVLLQNASFFQFVPNADGWMMGTGWIKTANIQGFGFVTHWRCFGVAPAEGAVLSRYDLNVSFYLFNATGDSGWSSCVQIPIGTQQFPWGFLETAVYVGKGKSDIGNCETDTWSTNLPSNMSAVSVCSGTNVPVYASQFTSRYFAGGNVVSFDSQPNKSLFDIPIVCEKSTVY